MVEQLVKRFHGRGRGQPDVVAVDHVTFSVQAGTTFGLVGESGSGKSTVARCLLGLAPVDEGRIQVLGHDITQARDKQRREWCKDMQIVFQEPYESLDPRIRVGAAIAEPLIVNRVADGARIQKRVVELMERVDLRPDLHDRFPHELSGGQQQRVNIARALATQPQVLVLDEPTSSLDVSVRAEILRLLVSLQDELGMTYVWVSHDLGTVRSISDRVAVMYLGRVVEEGPTADVLRAPSHPYTQFLISSELPLDPDEELPKPLVRADRGAADRRGCVFVARCPSRIEPCYAAQPAMRTVGPGHGAACILLDEDVGAILTTQEEPGEPL